ncbi:MAG: UDP-N-acetylmuramate dehydrogenase [Lachnospiraceae bacterium]|nr:UDP-N-acetylmuramate dehydrogenase [Lachnospiraceae bacterium]
MEVFFEALSQSLQGEDSILREEPMSRHTTFKVGGPAEYFVTVTTTESLREVVLLCEKYGVPWVVLGNGSNVLVSDSGIRGVVLCLAGEFTAYEIKEDMLSGRAKAMAGAGVPLSLFAMKIAKKGFTGFEFAAGIPGSVGGAVVMNAGAYGGEIKDCITKAEIVTADGEIKELSADELKLSYRHSILSEERGIVTRAWFSFPIGSKLYILSNIEMLNRKRREKQPLEFPSAGSTFKRPAGNFAGKLIMEAGLAGFRIGGAAVSEKHCGFVINKENATAADIYALMRHIITTVEEKSGVRLEPEVKLLGVF